MFSFFAKIRFSIFLAIAFIFSFMIAPLHQTLAAISKSSDYFVRDAGYAGEVTVITPFQLRAKPGETVLFSVAFVNIGQESWKNSGKKFVSLYTVRPNYHESVFYQSSWHKEDQVLMKESRIAPQEIAHFEFKLLMPSEEGFYNESFRLAAEDYSWIAGTEFQISVTVQSQTVAKKNSPFQLLFKKNVPVSVNLDSKTSPESIKEKVEQETPVLPAVPYKDTEYSAQGLTVMENIALQSAEEYRYRVEFKNIGSKKWQKKGKTMVSLYTTDPHYRASSFYRGSIEWLSPNQISMDQDEVLPGEKASFTIHLQAPMKAGEYVEKFRMAVENHTWIRGGELVIPIVVREKESSSGETFENLGPLMRVGLFHTDEEVVITSSSPYEIRDSQDAVLYSPLSGEKTSVLYDFDSDRYTVSSGTFTKTIDNPVRIIGTGGEAIFEILSYEHRVSWDKNVNDNLFRDSLEIRFAKKTGKLWVINELPMEHYLRGIAETSNGNPQEYLKAMTIAARTYAYYHYEKQTKHAHEFYHVDAYYDQVYRGYGAEKRFTDLQEAVDDTSGLVVTYEGKIAVTPYYSQSDGRTRAWSEVWFGDIPWLQSVPVPQDEGKKLLGHGVGMSARGALVMAREDGMTYDQILKHFYTNIVITDRY